MFHSYVSLPEGKLPFVAGEIPTNICEVVAGAGEVRLLESHNPGGTR